VLVFDDQVVAVLAGVVVFRVKDLRPALYGRQLLVCFVDSGGHVLAVADQFAGDGVQFG